MKIILLFAGVKLKLLGRAKVHWSENSYDSDNRRTKDYGAEEIYINERVYVFGARESILCVVRPTDADVCQSVRPYKVPLYFVDT